MIGKECFSFLHSVKEHIDCIDLDISRADNKQTIYLIKFDYFLAFKSNVFTGVIRAYICGFVYRYVYYIVVIGNVTCLYKGKTNQQSRFPFFRCR